jgi:hypothetical protein
LGSSSPSSGPASSCTTSYSSPPTQSVPCTSQPPSPLTSQLQLLNSTGLLLLTQSILILQPTHTPSQKIYGTHLHFLIHLLGISCLLTGLIIIEINKGSHARFTSVHGCMGLITYILILLQALVGFAQFYIPKQVFGSVDKGKAVYKYHRMGGYLVLLMGLATVCAATQTSYNLTTLNIQLWAVIVAGVLVVAGVGSRIKKQKIGF